MFKRYSPSRCVNILVTRHFSDIDWWVVISDTLQCVGLLNAEIQQRGPVQPNPAFQQLSVCHEKAGSVKCGMPAY